MTRAVCAKGSKLSRRRTAVSEDHSICREGLFRNRTDSYQVHGLSGEKSAGQPSGTMAKKSQACRRGRQDAFESCAWYLLTAGGVTPNRVALEQIHARWFRP